MADQSMGEIRSSAPVEVRQREFIDSSVGRQLRRVNSTTVPIDLIGISQFGKYEHAQEVAQLPVNLKIEGLLSGLETKGLTVSDLMGNVAVAFPKTHIGLSPDLPRNQRIDITGRVKGLIHSHQEALFLAAALKEPNLNWVKMEQELGIRNPKEAKRRIDELLESRKKREQQLTKALLGTSDKISAKSQTAKPRRPLISVGREAQFEPVAIHSQVDADTASKYERGSATVQTAIAGLTVVGLAVALEGCSTSPIDSTPLNSEQVLGTAQSMTETYQTPKASAPTTTPTETSIPTEVAELRVEPLTIDEIFDDQQDAKIWEFFWGSYFSGQPELEKPEEYNYIDFSYEGQVRIVESSDLDEHSWGLATLRSEKIEDGGLSGAPLQIPWAIHKFVDYGRRLEVVWGDFETGTVFAISDQISSAKMSEEELKKLIIPTGDSRFTCTEVNTFYILPGPKKGTKSEFRGIVCEYAG